MAVYEINLAPPPRFTFAGVTHALAGYTHFARPSLYQAEFFAVEKGTLCMECDDERVEACAGEVIFHPAGCSQRGWAPSPRGCVFAWVHFTGGVREVPSGEANLARVRGTLARAARTPALCTQRLFVPSHCRPAHFAEILECSYRLAERGPRLAVERDGLLQVLMGRIAVSSFGTGPGDTRGPAERAVERIKYWIDKNVDRPSSVTQIAAHMRMNPDYMNRLFRKHTGLSIRDYLKTQKLDCARHLLAGGASVKEAAAAAGFDNAAYFSRKFRAFTGVPPSVYRETAGDVLRN